MRVAISRHTFALIRAARTDDVARIREIARAGAKLDEPDSDGRTALFAAVFEGRLAATTALLDLGASPEAHGDALIPVLWDRAPDPGSVRRGTLLHVAAHRHHVALISLLAERGFEVDARDRDGATPLLHAAHGVGSRAAVERLLELGASPDARDEGGQVPLQVTGDPEIAKLLLEKGAAPEGDPASPRSPLGTWVKRAEQGSRFVDGVEALLKAGASVQRTHEGWTPLAWAAEFGRAEFVEALLAAGADVNAGGDGPPPIYHAARHAYLSVVERLLEAGASDLGPALVGAAAIGNLELMRRLLDAGAPVGFSGPQGTPLHAAVASDHAPVVAMLLARGADPNAKNEGGETPLHVAAQKGAEKSARQLVDARADRTAVDARGRTPSAVAEDHGRHNVSWLLRPGKIMPLAVGPAVEPRPEGPLTARLGGRVRHRVFGEGKIVEINGTGEEAKIGVSFRSGRKLLVARFLEVIE